MDESRPPGIQGLPQAAHPARIGVGPVAGFHGVTTDVIELGSGTGFTDRVGYDQFPLVLDDPTPAQSLLGMVEVGYVVGETGAQNRVASAECPKIGEVESRASSGNRNSGGLKQGWEQVDGAHRSGDGPGPDLPGPADQDGSAQAAVMGGLLGSGCVPGIVQGLDPAVVGDVGNHGVGGESASVQRLEEFPDGFVEPLDHGPVTGDVDGRGEGSVVVEQSVGWGMRIVRHERCVPHQPRLGGLGGFPDEIVDGLEGFASDAQAFITVATPWDFFAPGHSVGETAVAEVTLPPFAGLEAAITGGGELSGQGGEVGHALVHPVASIPELGGSVSGATRESGGQGWIIAGDPVLMRIPTGQDGREAGTAQAGRHVASGEPKRLRGESVDVRGADVWMSHEPVVRPCVVIGDDEQDVGGLGSGFGCRSRGGDGAKAKEDETDQEQERTRESALLHPTKVRGPLRQWSDGGEEWEWAG